jgi:hypothetical protein
VVEVARLSALPDQVQPGFYLVQMQEIGVSLGFNSARISSATVLERIQKFASLSLRIQNIVKGNAVGHAMQQPSLAMVCRKRRSAGGRRRL